MSAETIDLVLKDDGGSNLHVFSIPKNKLDATGAPSLGNDDSEGYVGGSLWVDRTNDEVYICTDNAAGAAVWEQIAPAGSGGVVETIVPGDGIDVDDTDPANPIVSVALTVGDIPDLSSIYQPLDGDLTAIAALSGTNTIYYRSGANTWTAVTIGSGLSFSAGSLTATAVGLTDGDKGDIVVSSTGTVWTIDIDAVTYAKMQNATESRLLGRGQGSGDGNIEEISLGTGLSLTGTTLSATNVGDVVGPSSATDNAIARYDGTTGKLIQNSAVTIDDSGGIESTYSDASTNASTTIINRNHTTSGTAAAGFGSGERWALESSSGTLRDAYTRVVTWATATDASRKSRIVYAAHNNSGSVECFRIEAGASAGMIGFLGATAAVAQTGDAGTALVTFGLMTGTPTFAAANLSGSALPSGLVASQSDMETATDTGKAVTAGRTQYHPGVAKVWLNAKGTTTIATNGSYNCTFARNGTGDYTITIGTDFSGTGYSCLITGDISIATTNNAMPHANEVSKSAGALTFYTHNSVGTQVDWEVINCVMFGDQ